MATDFSLPVRPESGYYNANPFLALNEGKYHLGDDLSGNGRGNTDYDDPVYPTAVGKVVKAFDQKGPVGKVVVIKHLLPDSRVMYSYYFHLSQILVSLNQIVYPNKPLGKIGDANGYYAGAAHLHFELRRANQSTSSSYYPTLTIATARKYLDPSLFIDDRASHVWVSMAAGTLTASNEDIQMPDYAPVSLAYATHGGKTLSLALAIEAGWFDPTAYVSPYSDYQWKAKPLDSMVFSPNEDFQIKFLKTCALTIVVPGHNFQMSRARRDMIQAADQAGLARVKLETLSNFDDPLSADYDLRYLCFDYGAGTAVVCLVHATDQENPLNRWVIWYDPIYDTNLGGWTKLDPNDIG